MTSMYAQAGTEIPEGMGSGYLERHQCYADISGGIGIR